MPGQYDNAPKPKWQAGPDDAIKLAAIRWFACMIEAEAIQIYATDSSQFLAIEEALKGCVQKIHSLRPPKPVIGEEGECPPGYVMCRGECAPMCFGEEPPEATAR